MQITRTVQVIDYHATGEPLRICPQVVHIPGQSMIEKFDHARLHLDELRRFLAHEPRGHGEMMGCLLTEPVNPGSLFGVLFFDTTMFNAACGHGSIVLATAAVEQGWITPVEGENIIRFDIPVGQIEVRAHVKDGEVEHAVYRGVPSFVHEADVIVDTSLGTVNLDIAFGGVFFAIIDTGQFGQTAPSFDVLTKLYFEIKGVLDKRGTVVLPGHPSIKDIDGVHFISKVEKDGYRIAWHANSIFSGGALDRSPCGTGTCACMANFHAKNEVDIGDVAFASSAPGEHFEAKIVEISSEDRPAKVTSEIQAKAYLTGFSTLVATQNDPFANGFVVSREA